MLPARHADIWSRCPPSVTMGGLPGQLSTEHQLAHVALLTALRGQTLKVSEACTYEMIEGANLLIAHYQQHVSDPGQQTSTYIARVVPTPILDVEPMEIPCYAVNHKTRTVHVWIYHYGHKRVEARDSRVLVLAMAAIRGDKNLGPEWSYRGHMVQPRVYDGHPAVDTWALPDDLLVRTALVLASASRGVGGLSVGRHCHLCLARIKCGAYRDVIAEDITMSTETRVDDLTPDGIGDEIRKLRAAHERIKAMLTGMESEASALIKRGTAIKGFTLAPVSGKQEWSVPTDAIQLKAIEYGVIVAKPVECITPKQAIKAGVPSDVVNNMSITRPGKEHLVEITEADLKRRFE